MFFDQMHAEWQSLLLAQRTLLDDIEGKLADESVQPNRELVMRAFALPPNAVKVVILGQDPYPNPEHAVGLAFAVPPGTRPLPPTLRNILTELANDLKLDQKDAQGIDLAGWADQGVMLLNRHLTTGSARSLAHASLGWKTFTEAVVRILGNQTELPPIFVFWGSQAQSLGAVVSPRATTLCAPHPSPLSAYRGFFGSRPFSKINVELIQRGQTAINWLHA